VALPISGKATVDGHAVLPRGTTSLLPERADVLRFFAHWRQAVYRTDFDLSLLLLDDHFREVGQVSWTNLEADGVVHSGDVIDAADGATEFIDVTLADVAAKHVVPVVLVYAGEGFDEVVESLFGYMTHPRDRWWHQAPPSTRVLSGRARSCGVRGGSRCRSRSPGATTGGVRPGCTCGCAAGRR
jgi:hypothetical protein